VTAVSCLLRFFSPNQSASINTTRLDLRALSPPVPLSFSSGYIGLPFLTPCQLLLPWPLPLVQVRCTSFLTSYVVCLFASESFFHLCFRSVSPVPSLPRDFFLNILGLRSSRHNIPRSQGLFPAPWCVVSSLPRSPRLATCRLTLPTCSTAPPFRF